MPNIIVNIYYTCCDWSVTVFISGYCQHSCDVTAYFPALFYKRNVRPCVYIITWCKRSREFGQIWKYMYLCRPSSVAWVHINFQILPNSFSRISGHFLLLKYLQWLWVVADQFCFYICLIKALNKQTNYSADVRRKCVCVCVCVWGGGGHPWSYPAGTIVCYIWNVPGGCERKATWNTLL